MKEDVGVLHPGSGIGRSCDLAYAKERVAGVAFCDIDVGVAREAAEEAKAVATNPEFATIAIRVDVTDEKGVDSMVDETVRTFGRLDYAFNAAGIGVREPAEIAEASTAEFKRFLDINVYGVFLCVRAESKAMKAQKPKKGPKDSDFRGVIINMGSAAAHSATPMLSQYTTSKHAVIGLTKNAALDNAVHGIRVVSVSPSWVDTPVVAAAITGNPALQEIINRAVPMQRTAHVDEISGIVTFLSSTKASYVTGSDWVVDGGTLVSAQYRDKPMSETHYISISIIFLRIRFLLRSVDASKAEIMKTRFLDIHSI